MLQRVSQTTFKCSVSDDSASSRCIWPRSHLYLGYHRGHMMWTGPKWLKQIINLRIRYQKYQKNQLWFIFYWNMFQWLKQKSFNVPVLLRRKGAFLRYKGLSELNETYSKRKCSWSIFQSTVLYTYSVKCFRMGAVRHKVIITCQDVRQALLQHRVRSDFPYA